MKPSKLTVYPTLIKIMEGSTLSLMEDVEDLIFDTRLRIKSGKDPYTSAELVPYDVNLAKKNLKEIRKIFSELTENRKIFKHTREMQLHFGKLLNEYDEVEKEVNDISDSVFGPDASEVSSIIAPYNHFDCPRLYDPKTEDSVDEDGIPTWVAPSCRHLYLPGKVYDKLSENGEDEKCEAGSNERKRKKREIEMPQLERVECSPIKRVKLETDN